MTLRTLRLASITLGLAAFLAAAPHTQAQTFTCDNDIFISQSFDNGSNFQLSRLNQSVFPYTLDAISTTSLEYNAIGFNYLDGFIYGIKPTSPNTVYRIDNTGTLTSIGTVSGLPTQRYFSGTIARDGTLYLADGGPIDTSNPTRDLYVITGLDTDSPTVVNSFSLAPITGTTLARYSDLALTNDDSFLYGFARNTNQVVRIDPATGAQTPLPATTSLGTVGGLWFNSYGELFGRRGLDGSFYQFDLVSGAATVVSTGPPSQFNDATSCPYAVGFTKETSQSVVDPGETFTYTFTLFNNGLELTGIDFLDEIPSGLTFVDGTLSTTLGGTANSFGGTNRLEITDLTLPANTASVITVDVFIPPSAPNTTFDNQAVLSDLGVFLGSTLNSDDPTTPIFGDPTTVGINIPVELTAFDVTLDGRAASLAWTTVSETNNSGFEVQMRRPATDAFEALGFVEGRGTTTETQSYAFRADDLAPGTYTFRLKQIDFDGAFAYSPEVEAKVVLTEAFDLEAIYPNPFRTGDAAQASLSVQQSQAVTVTLYDALGRIVATLHDGRVEAGEALDLRLDGRALASGVYVLRATGETFGTTRRVTVIR